MKKIKIIIRAACCFMLMSCVMAHEVEMKSLRVYNAGDRDIALIECSGIDLFGDSRNSMITSMYGDHGKRVPREYGPDDSMTLNTWGDVVQIEYPIVVKWAYQSNPKGVKETKFDQIINLKKGQKEIRGEGSMNLVFHDGAFYLIWVKNERNLYRKDYLKILKDLKK